MCSFCLLPHICLSFSLAGCCITSHCTTSASCCLLLRCRLLSMCRLVVVSPLFPPPPPCISSPHATASHNPPSWLLRCLSSCRPLVCAGEGQPTIRWRRCSSKGQLMVLKHHRRYPLVRYCHCRHCKSRVSQTVPRHHCCPHMNKGWPTKSRRLVIIVRARGNRQRQGAIVGAAADVIVAQGKDDRQC